MFNFNGGSGISGISTAALSGYAGYMLLSAGNIWISIGFLTLTAVSACLVVCTLCRYVINYHRNSYLLLD